MLSLKKKIISLVIYIFRGHVRAYMKDNGLRFEIIYIHCGLCVWFHCYIGEGVKFTENSSFKRTESQKKIQTT